MRPSADGPVCQWLLLILNRMSALFSSPPPSRWPMQMHFTLHARRLTLVHQHREEHDEPQLLVVRQTAGPERDPVREAVDD